MDYDSFLRSKLVSVRPIGFEVENVNLMLFPWQRAIVKWALRLGRSAIFSGCGTGKTGMQLEWAQHVASHDGAPVLILAPLAVAHQTAHEGAKFGIHVTVCRSQDDVSPGVNVTNYDMLHAFDTASFAGVVLDESSILKNFSGVTKRRLMAAFQKTRYKLCCTATPAPNDYLELGNHAQFLDVMDSNEMISRWFINDTMAAGSYRLKRHAEGDFWSWVASWSVCLERPSDLGYEDAGFELPELRMHQHIVAVDHSRAASSGKLFVDAALSATTMHEEMRLTAGDRASKVAEIVAAEPNEFWTIWCNTNYEADALIEEIPGAIEIRGSDSVAVKERALDGFSDGKIRTLVSKPSIAGFGMNWQHCARVAFVGLSYSYEQFYQALRRSWRFGQERPVDVHVVIAESEGGVLDAIKRKEIEHEHMQRSMRDAMRESQLENVRGASRLKMNYTPVVKEGPGWKLHLGDCVDVVRALPDNHIKYSIFSPPFSNLYIYSDSYRDMGNTTDDDEFFAHFEFLIEGLFRATSPGRLCSVHCKDLPLYKGRDGAAGLRDFPGRIIGAFEHAGWTFHSRCTIWKDPVIEMQRTKNHGLLYKQLCKDSSYSRQGMADYLITFRKWERDGEEADPVSCDGERFEYYSGLEPPNAMEIAQWNNLPAPRQVKGKWPSYNPFPHGSKAFREWSIAVWQRYASPVWFDIDQTDVLNYEIARDGKDEKHICPLQLGVIERAVHLWSNPGDLVFSPFSGIGSEGYKSLKCGRRFEGAELKESYWSVACRNLAEAAESDTRQLTLADLMHH
jgi:hypothetical protein